MNQVKEKRASALAMIQQVHPDAANLVEEYPLVFQEGHAGRVLTLGSGNQVDSACAILVRDFLVQDMRIPGGLIGSVSTAEDKRNTGLASRILELAEEELRREGCIFALLWADVPEFYCQRGYGPIGAEDDFVISDIVAEGFPSPHGARPATAGDTAAIHGLYEEHTLRVDRTEDETRVLLGCPGMRTLVLERDGAVVAYTCLGRVRDLADAIHEWGGESSHVLALVRAHSEERRAQGNHEGLFLMAPPAGNDLTYRLTISGAISRRGVLGLGKILNREGAGRLLADRLGAGGQVEVQAEGYYLTGPDDEGLLDEDAMIAILFSCPEAQSAVTELLKRFGLTQAKLPVHPFAWGLDSI